jgi:hypothetical protein
MTFDADILEHPALALPAAADPRIAVAEMWLCMLGGLRQVAKHFYSFLVREIGPYPNGRKGAIFPFSTFGDPVAAFKHVVRALRFVALLSAKIEKEIAALRAGLPLGPHAFIAKALRNRARREASGETAGHNPKERQNLDAAETLAARQSPESRETLSNPEPLSDDDHLQALLKRSLKTAIAAICADLGLKPDWQLWTQNGFPPPPGGGAEDWAAFFCPEASLTPPTPRYDEQGRWAEGWRSACPTPQSPDPSPPPCPAATSPPDRGASP